MFDEKIKHLQGQLNDSAKENIRLKEKIKEQTITIESLNKRLEQTEQFSLDSVLSHENKLKGLFKYYTGITYVRFLTLLSVIVPPGSSVKYTKNRSDIAKLSDKDCLFLCLCRLRQNFGLKDIAMRFGLSLQSAGEIFQAWLEQLYFKLGQMSIWPHRDIIYRNMPSDFRKEFPTTFIIIDGTELKTQSPCALGLQSQMYSDYKSSTTLKCLIGCDPSGSLIFVSELFTGSISDKALTNDSGFYDILKTLLEKNYLKPGDAVMADKGFTIDDELKQLGLKLNIPPLCPKDTQMPTGDTELTQTIAKHRIHIERLIGKAKKFRIISYVIPTSLFKNINKIWTVCCLLTLFQDKFVIDKNAANTKA